MRLRFQSTLPARGATTNHSGSDEPKGSFNPRSPRGERLGELKEEEYEGRFQSTLPARGATGRLCHRFCPVVVSIHAPRAGSDAAIPLSLRVYIGFNPRSPRGERRASKPCPATPAGFNPRSPRGERLGFAERLDQVGCFNPRSPRGERLQPGNSDSSACRVSIHAPRAGSDNVDH